MNSGTGIYKSGVLAFFAGAILIGALLGAVTFCFMGSDELYEIPKRDWSSDVCSSDLVVR